MSKNGVELFTPDIDTNGRYGRDFIDEEVGIGRIVLQSSVNPNTQPTAFLNLFEAELDPFHQPFREGPAVELINDITDDDSAIRMLAGFKFAIQSTSE